MKVPLELIGIPDSDIETLQALEMLGHFYQKLRSNSELREIMANPWVK